MPLLDGGSLTKICRICSKEKVLSDYHPNKTCRLGVVGTCRQCYAVKMRPYYNKIRDTRNSTVKEKNREKKRKWVSLFGDKCFDCGNSYPDCVYDFHHLYGKDANPSKALTWSDDRAIEELSKCVLLCANCHRIRHFGKEVVNGSTY